MFEQGQVGVFHLEGLACVGKTTRQSPLARKASIRMDSARSVGRGGLFLLLLQEVDDLRLADLAPGATVVDKCATSERSKTSDGRLRAKRMETEDQRALRGKKIRH